jgi:hypothetical protein
VSRFHLAAAVTSCALVFGCSESIPTGPSLRPITPSVKRTTSTQRATLFKNSIKYRDTGLKPASGRSGNASLIAEALLGRDGSTALRVTAGVIDEPPNGTLTMVQIKQFDPNGLLQRTTNTRAVSGSEEEFTLSGRVRGSNLQIQASITGVDGNRTDVVTVTETVKLRPDIVAFRVDAFPEVVQNAQAVIYGRFRERNGDVGAYATCILEVDGQVVDQVPTLWFNAGGEIGCGFSHRFAETGTKTITVRATNVSPGDWDLSNNALSSSIVVKAPQPPDVANDFTWTASVDGSRDVRSFYRTAGWWEDIDGFRSDWERYEQRDGGGGQWYMHMFGATPRMLDGPVHVTFKDWMDGTLLHDDQYIEDVDWRYHNDFGTFFQQHCSIIERTEELQGERGPFRVLVANVGVCSARQFGEPLGTNFSYFQQNGDATYYSNGWSRTFGPEYESSWSFNGTITYSYGTLAFGSEYRFELVFTSGEQRLVAAGAMAFAYEDVVESYPYQCTTYSDEFFTEYRCDEYATTYRRFFGTGSGVPTTP